jgi:transcriptional regulator with XRE-family HTH domain
MSLPVWDGRLGTAGGAEFGASLSRLCTERDLSSLALAGALEISTAMVDDIFEGRLRVGVSALARMARALRCKAIEFLQRCGVLSLEAYAYGLDPLYFLPEGQLRYDARIYMREINPRHQVPEADMMKRNATLSAISSDEVLDALGKLELELAYLLRAAFQHIGDH